MTVIMDSQRARGVETQGNIFVRAKALIPSLVPLVVSAFMSSEERALALESKGFEYECEKPHLSTFFRTSVKNMHGRGLAFM